MVGAIILLALLAIGLGALIKYIQHESIWTVKETRTTTAFQLAEAGVERGFQNIIQSTTVWNTLQTGSALSGFHFDTVYTDLSGGQYSILVTSGPGTQEATVIAVGQDSSTKELRAVKAIYGNTAANACMYAMGGITLTSNPSVEWGPVFSPNTISTVYPHPRFFSAGNIVGLDPNGPTPPNSDNTQWWSYDSNLPPPPQIDLQAYLAAATAAGQVRSGGTYSLGNVSGTWYFTGDTTLKPNSFVQGDLIVMGNLTLQGNAASGSEVATIPSNAWKEYGNDWSTWRSDYDGGAGAWPGINGTYSTSSSLPLTVSIDKVVTHGFLYVLNSFSITGGGNCCVHGSMYLGNASSLDGSHVKIYYDDTLIIKTKNVSLVRESWQETHCSWSGTTPTCP